MTRRVLAAAFVAVSLASSAPASAQSFDVAEERLRLEAQLETVQLNGALFFGGGFATLAGLGGLGGSGAWLAQETGDAGPPTATLITFAVVAAVGIVLVALGIVDALDVQARRQRLEQRRDALGAATTGMFRIGLGSGGELRIR